MPEGAFGSATGLRDALRTGEVSAREAVASFLGQIESQNRLLGAYLTVTAEHAHDAAAAADSLHARLSRSGRLDELPALHGMPTAFKDLTDVAGVPTTHGSAALDARPAPADSPIAALLRGAGAISLGKTQVPEFGLTAYSENRIAPPSRNPYGPALSSGGSSGGSAAAVAAALAPFAPGSDGGGSIRIPAAACGIIGLKPGRGLIPEGQSTGDAARLVVAGPLARSAKDAALMMDVLLSGEARGENPHSGRHAGTFVDAVVREPRRLRVAVSLASPWDARYEVRADPEAREALRRGAEMLAAAGHLVVEQDVRFDNRYPDAFTAAWTAGVGAARIRPEREPLLTPLTRSFRRRAQQRSHAKLEEALAFLRQFERDVVAQLSRWDVLLSPALAQTARPVGWFSGPEWRWTADEDYRRQCEFAPWSSWVNVCGLPAVVATTYWTEAGLPMGVQAVGHLGSEAVLLQLARLLHLAEPPSGPAGSPRQ
ncbi:amidase [Sinomonas notoginsengisoli]|uniref:amidase n=1 Tax=Sinomonas notoginsengisoli TaxID=1457311 RepID=UPI0035580450